jgi:predicted dehydrogenase
MQFALLGDHPDGLDMARALVESGRHRLAAYCGPAAGADYLRRWASAFRGVTDLEDVLADPAIKAVIVAGRPADRPDQLRRALQSERHVLCVHPVDTTPDTAYEAAMIQGDTRHVLLPLLPESLHPGVRRLAELARAPSAGLGTVRLVEMERWAADRALLEAGGKRRKPALPGWDVLRTLGGEIAEVFAFAAREEVDPQGPLLLSGRFESGGLFHAVFLSGQNEARLRLSVIGSFGRADLIFPQGWPGPARLSWPDEAGLPREESWETWNSWPALVERFEQAVAANERPGEWEQTRWENQRGKAAGLTSPPVDGRAPDWQDVVRQLELDDAARRSVEKRRASLMEYQEASEEAGFKGTMTLIGCGLLWGSLLLLIASRWVPWAGWLIPVLFALFLIMQLFRWVAQRPTRQE